MQLHERTPYLSNINVVHKAFVCAEKCGKSNSSGVCQVTCYVWPRERGLLRFTLLAIQNSDPTVRTAEMRCTCCIFNKL